MSEGGENFYSIGEIGWEEGEKLMMFLEEIALEGFLVTTFEGCEVGAEEDGELFYFIFVGEIGIIGAVGEIGIIGKIG